MALMGVCATVFKRTVFGSWKSSAVVCLGAVFVFGLLLLLSLDGCIIEWLGNHGYQGTLNPDEGDQCSATAVGR